MDRRLIGALLSAFSAASFTGCAMARGETPTEAAARFATELLRQVIAALLT